MTDDDHIAARTAANRRQAADFFDGLDDAALATQSLCGEWTVRDILGHLTMPWTAKVGTMLPAMVKARGNFHKASAAVARQVAQRPVAELTAVLRDHAETRWSPPGIGLMGQFTDGCVHLRDAARPVGSGVDVPLEDWRLVLDFLPTPRARRGFMKKGRLDGLHLRATDQDWSHGEGAEVTGSSEALAMAMLGRSVAYADLTGPGVDLLRARR